jgi:hypothetical protein
MEVDGRAMEHTSAKDIGYNTAAIHNLIRKAFTVEELRRFCRDQPVLRPVCDEFAPEHGLNDLADEVIAYCQTRLVWEDLLAAIAQERPRQYAHFEPMLRGPEYAESLPSAERIGQGLVALAELMQVDDVQTAMVTFHADFRAARDQIGLLNNHKYLHDLLHELQFHCYTPILQAARRFPDDDLAAEDLEYYELTFQRIVDDLEEAATGATSAEDGRLLVTAADDLTAKVWDAGSGEL